jgi:multimeric flavodoxin WrbA
VSAREPRVLGLAGSPRRHGNSDRLLEACLAGAGSAGAETDLLVVSAAGIEPCLGCEECSATGECAVGDGMQNVYQRLDAADAIVVSTPVYFATVPAVLKALYDRCQPYWVRRYRLGQPIARRRPGALLIVGGGGDPYGHECAATTTRSVFAVLGVDYSAELAVRADSPTDAAGQPDSLKRARDIGDTLARDAAGRLGGDR